MPEGIPLSHCLGHLCVLIETVLMSVTVLFIYYCILEETENFEIIEDRKQIQKLTTCPWRKSRKGKYSRREKVYTKPYPATPVRSIFSVAKKSVLGWPENLSQLRIYDGFVIHMYWTKFLKCVVNIFFLMF